VLSRLPLFAPAQAARPIAWRDGRQIQLGEFALDVAAVACTLPARSAMINLCEDRYRFLAAFAAALSVGHAALLPPTRAEQVVKEIEGSHPGSYRWEDAVVDAALSASQASASLELQLPAEQIATIGFTSGSTGQPQSYSKDWRSVNGSTACNARAIRAALGVADDAPVWILATVPPQHTYGMEFSVLLPLIAGMAVHAARPLFPADIARALDELPTPRVLVSTPVHLHALVESQQQFPEVALTVCATAPLDRALAQAVEAKLGGRLLEIFGSTETCAFASRRTAQDELWRLHDGVRLEPMAEGTLVAAPWNRQPILLQDTVELHGTHEFHILGRNADLIEVAGKRASLADLTRRVLAIDGVQDAVVFQPGTESVATIRRVAALVVAPGLTAVQIHDLLAASVDPAFLPRPLLLVDALPRNELGKLPRAALLAALVNPDFQG
jgi:acyl-coenzyme A synthetase/AMP-(fatty) acid ligase